MISSAVWVGVALLIIAAVVGLVGLLLHLRDRQQTAIASGPQSRRVSTAPEQGARQAERQTTSSSSRRNVSSDLQDVPLESVERNLYHNRPANASHHTTASQPGSPLKKSSTAVEDHESSSSPSAVTFQRVSSDGPQARPDEDGSGFSGQSSETKGTS